MQDSIKQIIKDRQQKTSKKSESLARLEEQLFEAESKGNTRKANALRIVIKRIKKGPRKGP